MQFYLILGNILSLAASVCTAISVIKRNKTDFMYWQVGNTLFAILTNIALLSYSGVTTNAVSLMRNILAYKNKLTVIRTFILLTFSISLGLWYNNIGYIGLLPVFSSAGYTLCVYLTKNEQQLRYALIVDLSLWATYYLYIQAYPSVVTYSVLNIWTAIQIFKNRSRYIERKKQLIKGENMNKLIIWDFDGVVADSEKLWIPVWVETLKKEKNICLSEDETFNLLVGIADREKKINLEKHFPGLILDDDFLKKVEDGYIYNEIHCMEQIEGVESVMQDNRFAHCIATGADRKQHARKITKFKWIEKYMSADDYFTVDMVKHGKPAPDIFLLAATLKGYKPEDCLVIGDSLNDFKAANAAGMKSIAFVGAEGNDTPEYRQKCIDTGVIAVCSTMKEVKQALNNFVGNSGLFNIKNDFSR